MKTHSRIGILIVVLALALAPASRAGDVYELFISGKGSSQNGATVQSRKVTQVKIVNAALDLDPDANVSTPTKVLGVVSACSNFTDVVIWDLVAGQPVATIGSVDLRGVAMVSNVSYSAILDLSFITTNRLLATVHGAENILSVGVKGALVPNNCLSSFSGKLLGTFNYVGDGGATSSVVIVSGKAALGGKLGTVP